MIINRKKKYIILNTSNKYILILVIKQKLYIFMKK